MIRTHGEIAPGSAAEARRDGGPGGARAPVSHRTAAVSAAPPAIP